MSVEIRQQHIARGNEDRNSAQLTVDLPPAHVVPQVLVAGIADGTPVERRQRRRERCSGKVRGPEKRVIGREGRHDRGR